MIGVGYLGRTVILFGWAPGAQGFIHVLEAAVRLLIAFGMNLGIFWVVRGSLL